MEDLLEDGRLFQAFSRFTDDVLWITKGATREIEYLSPAFERVWGVPREAALSDPAVWIEALHPDDIPNATQAFPRALNGESCIAESDQAFRWIAALDKGLRLSNSRRDRCHRADRWDRAGCDRKADSGAG
ncbi:MAG: hypothetical protein EOP21_10660 [Hyphomicrobiales bacterium]|nr:MAG: hypothetical protein EOP21_10660 [Hyphomicrobiales bacterium]